MEAEGEDAVKFDAGADMLMVVQRWRHASYQGRGLKRVKWGGVVIYYENIGRSISQLKSLSS